MVEVSWARKIKMVGYLGRCDARNDTNIKNRRIKEKGEITAPHEAPVAALKHAG